jgi:signal transduction histidine kinase
MTSLRIAAQSVLHQLNRQSPPDPATLERMIHVVDRQVGRLSGLVTHLLDTVRLQSGTLQLERTPTDLAQLVRDVLQGMQAQTMNHHVIVTAAQPVWACVDGFRLEQVITNLLDNAVKFSPEGSRIDIEVAALSPREARITVRDRGIGVPPEHRAHLFTRFYQAHASEHRSGMGLGLYICREIVEQHGGTIDVEFPPDGGTCFVVELPAQ